MGASSGAWKLRKPSSGLHRLAFAVLVVCASCAVDDGSTQVTLAPLGTPNDTRPASTVTTEAPAVAPTTAVALPPTCAFAPLGGQAEVSFEVGSRLYSMDPRSSAVACLADLPADASGPLQWAPSADRVLLNSSNVYDGVQFKQTGYLSTNVGVHWSQPTGKALIAPAVADAHLLWRTAGEAGSRRDISFLARTDVATYHPAGRNIFAAGQAADGTSGLFVASNRGENSRLLTQLDSPDGRITEIVADSSGARVLFVHDHGTGLFHVHSLSLPDLALADLTQATEPLANLTTAAQPGSPVAWRIGSCDTRTRTQVWDGAAIVEQPAGWETVSTQPVGWLDQQQLVIAVRPVGCAGPADLWLWTTSSPTAVHLVGGADQAAVRVAPIVPGELPDDINAQAPG